MSQDMIGRSGKKPVHVAVIMDGNGRWAERQGLPRMQGHLEGAESARIVAESCIDEGVGHLTLYAFSTENWGRPEAEVKFLMEQIGVYLSENREEMKRRGIRFRAIGRRAGLPDSVREEVDITEKYTEEGEQLQLLMALNYGARPEIADAARALCKEVVDGRIGVEDIDEKAVADRLYTAGIPDPDLVIRTGGEMRLSNFLLWQLSYAEIYVTETLWPEFRAAQLREALREYARRERRFGKVREDEV